MRWARALFVAVALAMLVWALASQWAPFVAAIRGANFWMLALAFGLASVALPLNAMSWRQAMAAVGIRLPTSDALQVFLISQVGKYVPGSVWPVVAQMEAAKLRGESRSTAASGSILAMAIGAVAAGIVGLGALARHGLAPYAWFAVVPIAGLVALSPPVFRRLLAVVFRLTKRPDAAPPIDGRRVLVAGAWSLGVWAALGAHVWLITGAIAPAAVVSPVLVVGVFACAWLVGFVVILAPAGAGVRELVLVAGLAGAVSAPQALAVSLTSRVVMTLADGIGAIAALASRRSRT